MKQNLNSFSFVTASPFLCLRFSPDHQVADVSGQNPTEWGLMLMPVREPLCYFCFFGADNCNSICTGVLLLVLVHMLVLVLDRIQLSKDWCWSSYLCSWYSCWYWQGYYILQVGNNSGAPTFPVSWMPDGSSLCPFTTKCRFYKVQHRAKGIVHKTSTDPTLFTRCTSERL